MKIKLELNEQLSRIRTIMNLNEDVKHIYQPTGNSCGPTCIKMVGDFIKGDVGEIDEICIECGTDWVVGTPPDRMKIGLDKLGVKYIEHISEIEPFQSLKNVIDKGNKCIVRTITDGVPHWIVIYSYKGNIFNVNDPWKGPIRYNEKQLSAIWKVRDFFFFEIITGNQRIFEGVKIRKMEDKDIPYILKKISKIFSKTGLNNKEIWEEIKHFDLNLSFVGTIDDNIAGFYFLGKDQIPEGGENYDELKDLNGVEGIALGVLPEYKNAGVGKKLIEHSQNLPGVDYVWGYQFKSLKNIDDWLKRRKIYFENDEYYITYQIIKKGS